MRAVRYVLVGIMLVSCIYGMTPCQKESDRCTSADKGKDITTVNNGLVDVGNYKRKRSHSDDDTSQYKYTCRTGDEGCDCMNYVSDNTLDSIIDRRCHS